MNNSFYEDEIMVLKSIYEDKVEITDNKYRDNTTTISMMLYPSTAEDVASQYVRLLLELTVNHISEDAPVEVNLKTSRGLSDDQLQSIFLLLTEHVQSNIGSSVLFDLIELAKDSLTSNNIPSCPCPICLAQFQEFDDFLKTECYHYLHAYCLHQYVIHWKEEKRKEVIPHHHRYSMHPKEHEKYVPCPVCRESILYDIDSLSKSTKPIEAPEQNFNLDNVKQEVKKMEAMYNLQKEKGGIIDLEAEKNKYLLSSIEQAYLAASTSSPERLATAEKNPSDSSKVEDSNSLTTSSGRSEQKDERAKVLNNRPTSSRENREVFSQNQKSSDNKKSTTNAKSGEKRISTELRQKYSPSNRPFSPTSKSKEGRGNRGPFSTKRGEKTNSFKPEYPQHHHRTKPARKDNISSMEFRTRTLSAETYKKTNRSDTQHTDAKSYLSKRSNDRPWTTKHKAHYAKVSEPRPAYRRPVKFNPENCSQNTNTSNAKDKAELPKDS